MVGAYIQPKRTKFNISWKIKRRARLVRITQIDDRKYTSGQTGKAPPTVILTWNNWPAGIYICILVTT